ncbi:MAG: phosphate ABC transporter permease subunit PstC [Bacteroidales bacterium]
MKNKRRHIRDRLAGAGMSGSLILLLLLPFALAGGLAWKSIPLLDHQSLGQLLLGTDWSPGDGKFGFFPFLASSFYVTFLAFLLAVPPSFLSALYLTQFSPPRLLRFMHPVLDILAGLPSVVYGVWGVLVIVPFVRDGLAGVFGVTISGYSILTGSIVLAVMHPLHDEHAGGGLSKCARRTQGIQPGIGRHPLGNGQARGVAQDGSGGAFLLRIGNCKSLRRNHGRHDGCGEHGAVPGKPFEAGYPLPALIANNYGEMLSIPLYDSALMFAALILLVVILAANLFFRSLIMKSKVK